jgi:hypothetical protein
MKKKRVKTYTLIDELQASPVEPMPAATQVRYMSRIYQGLRSIERDAEPSKEDWRVVSDAVNMLETLIDKMKVCEDASGLMPDAVRAMAEAGIRHRDTGVPIRFDAKGLQAVRAAIEDFGDLVTMLPHRTMVRCHRLTEQRIHEILDGKRAPHDVEIAGL